MPNRRDVLGRLAVAAAMSSATRARSAVPTIRTRGSLADVEHVVVLMQENRSFDHYFGALRGVRGFGDRRPLHLPNGDPVWFQRQRAEDGGEVVEPFRLDTRRTAAGCIKSLDHSWRGSWDRWKHHDVWMPEKGPLSMGHLTREDLPYYYALADAFTICDAYHCAIHGPTGPNRLFLFSGSSGASVGRPGPYSVTNDGCDDNPGADMAKDDPKFGGLDWTPYAARLEAAGVSWRVYQEYDNFSDNPLGYFRQFRALDRGSALYRRGRAWVEGSTPQNATSSSGRHLVAAFADDVASDRLPAVSWIVAPQALSEHPDAPPAYGQALTARLVAALAANPQVWRKTVLILNYDENDGFFDHMPPPTPAVGLSMGASTVDLRGESYGAEPIGLGPRVPCLVISPWTRGGWVTSEVFDHTSVIRLIERRFGVSEPNISPWRREVCGDLTSAFDFDLSEPARTDVSWAALLPDTGPLVAESDASCRLSSPVRPSSHAPAAQEPGVRPARPSPYRLDMTTARSKDALELTFLNTGTAGAVFRVDSVGGVAGPWSFTVGAGRSLQAVWSPQDAADASYHLSVRGPNGFLRELKGVWSYAEDAEPCLSYEAQRRRFTLSLANTARESRTWSVEGLSDAPNLEAVRLVLAPGERRRFSWRAQAPESLWYDVCAYDTHARILRRFCGFAGFREPANTEPSG